MLLHLVIAPVRNKKKLLFALHYLRPPLEGMKVSKKKEIKIGIKGTELYLLT